MGTSHVSRKACIDETIRKVAKWLIGVDGVQELFDVCVTLHVSSTIQSLGKGWGCSMTWKALETNSEDDPAELIACSEGLEEGNPFHIPLQLARED